MRWAPTKIYEFPQWLRNDVPKIKSKPGLAAMAERVDLAADLLDAVIAAHASCKTSVCPTRQAIERVLSEGDQP